MKITAVSVSVVKKSRRFLNFIKQFGVTHFSILGTPPPKTRLWILGNPLSQVSRLPQTRFGQIGEKCRTHLLSVPSLVMPPSPSNLDQLRKCNMKAYQLGNESATLRLQCTALSYRAETVAKSNEFCIRNGGNVEGNNIHQNLLALPPLYIHRTRY